MAPSPFDAARRRPLACLLAVVGLLLVLPLPSACATLAGVMAVLAAADRRNAATFAWTGIALVASRDAMVLLPFVTALAIARRMGWRDWVPATVVTGPALWIVSGLRISAPALPAPLLQALAERLPVSGDIPLLGLASAVAAGCVACYVTGFSVGLRGARRQDTFGAAILSMLLVAGLVPGMGIGALAMPMLVALTMHRSVAIGIGAGIALTLVGQPALGALALIAAGRTTWRTLTPVANDNAAWTPRPALI